MTTGPLIFSAEYYQRMRDLESAAWWNAGMRDIAGMLLSLGHLPASGTMLDVGCGSGQTMTWFRQLLPGWRTIGFDLEWEGVRPAGTAHPKSVFLGSALTIPMPSASVQLVVSLDVLQHLPLEGGDMQALAEIRRVLKPGGYLLARTNAQGFPAVEDNHQFNFHKYRPSEFRDKLERTGFVILRLSRVNALLGLAEIPRELRARQARGSGYHGLLSTAPAGPSWMASLKRSWLRQEGRVVRAGWTLPLGRTIVAFCRLPET